MIVVVCGPPCSGKSTYTRTHAKPGDITIDYDTLAQALGGQGHHHTPAQQRATLAARRAALYTALRAQPSDETWWVIDAQPGPNRLAQYQAVGARFVTLTADPALLHQRAHEQGRPRHHHGLIDRS